MSRGRDESVLLGLSRLKLGNGNGLIRTTGGRGNKSMIGMFAWARGAVRLVHETPRPLLLLIAALLAYHITLLGRGALAYPDEFMSFRSSIQIADGLLRGDLDDAAAGTIGFWGARPLEFIVRTPGALAQRAYERASGVPPTSPSSLPIAVAPNVLISAVLAIAFFSVSRELFGSAPWTTAGAAAFALLASNNIWVRHVVPYDTALAGHLFALGVALRIPKEPASRAPPWPAVAWAIPAIAFSVTYPMVFYRVRALGLPWAVALFALWALAAVKAAAQDPTVGRAGVRAGVAAGLALALYPAFYSFVAVTGVVVLFDGGGRRGPRPTWTGVLAACAYAYSVFAVVFAFEWIARVGGLSYLGSARLMPQTITQGTYSEGFVFIAKYLLAGDGPGAAALLILATLGAAYLARACWSGRLAERDLPLARTILALGAMYLFYGFQSAVLEQMTFTGRYSRMYVPLVVWLAVLGARSVWEPMRRVAIRLWLVAAVAGFALFATAYRAADYPADMLYDLRIGYEDLAFGSMANEVELFPDYTLPVKELTAGAHYVTHPGDTRFVLVNFGIIAVEGRPLQRYEAPPEARLLGDRLHFLALPWAPQEGYPLWKRDEIWSRAYRLQVYCLTDCPPQGLP
jgi:hypothetical protein